MQPGRLDVRTGNFSLFPRYDQNAKVNGWLGTTELVLGGRDFARITATAGKIKSLTLADASFEAVARPVTRAYLEKEGLGPAFIGYVASTWQKFVSD